ncbi:MAG: hypothetical protein ACXWO7_04025 [Candidatus Limnocylindrales bacterium]
MSLGRPAGAAGWGALLRDALRVEDVLLAGWVLLQPALAIIIADRAASGTSSSGGGDLLAGSDPLVGLLFLGATAGAVACLVTRPSDVPAGAVRDPGDWILVGPIGGGLILTGAVATGNLFGAPGVGMALAGISVVVGGLLPNVLPPVPVAVRRALVVPLILVTTSLFNAFVAGVAELFDLRSLFVGGLWTGLQALPLVLAFAVAFTGVFFLMLVVAPRQLAEREGGPFTWLLRYLLFLAAEIVAATWLGAARG